MDSINKQQPEDNHRDLQDGAASDKIKELVEKGQSCFFCTSATTGDFENTRPMSVQKIDDQGNIWFLSAIDSHKNQEIREDSVVRLYFQGSAYSDFLVLEGNAIISRDKEKIHELWEPMIKVWFTEGEDDPRITVIKFVPAQGYYWTTKHGKVVATMKMVVGALVGKTFDDSMEGNIEL
ncbi:MAG: pyridoxamine 5'-phosphate oxidase family protein [Bacteroidota bacterium]